MIIDMILIHDLSAPAAAATGDLTFTASADHFTTVYNYTAEARLQGTSTVVSTFSLGKPDPNSVGTITYNIASWLNSLTAGTYDVSVLVTGTGGSTDSGISNEFSVPLVAP